jgi:hypothetical protein
MNGIAALYEWTLASSPAMSSRSSGKSSVGDQLGFVSARPAVVEPGCASARLEIFGEVEPVLDTAHAEVIPAGGSDGATMNVTRIYEYWWTMGTLAAANRSTGICSKAERDSISGIDSKMWPRATT